MIILFKNDYLNANTLIKKTVSVIIDEYISKQESYNMV